MIAVPRERVAFCVGSEPVLGLWTVPDMSLLETM